MLDSKYLRQDIEMARELLASRHYELDVTALTALEEQRRQSMTRTQDLQAQRNRLSRAIGSALRQGAEVQALRDEVARVAEELTAVKHQQDAVLEQIRAIAETIPNLPDASVPPGEDERDNVEVRRVGTPRSFDFPVRDHATLGEQLGMLDLERARRLSGARFAVLSGPLCALQRATVRLMLDLHVQKQGYTECCVPYLVSPECLYGTGQLPKFGDDLFHTALRGTAADEAETRRFCLIPTAEVPLTNLVRNEILNAADLPLRLTAHTPCFRAEAGSAGRDTRGLIRMHQFDKVEMVQVVEPGQSAAALEQLTRDAEAVLQALELPYRVVCLCTGDLGFSAAKTYDLEVWLPAQQTYREISSCSNCTDFQARRMQTRVRTRDGGLALVHTLNGSGLAVGRTLVAILENYQNADGSVTIPAVLRPYLNGQEKLEVHSS